MKQTLLNNRYQILEAIGGGGMAEVYRATDTLLGREVAVKVLRAQFTDDEAFIVRFRKEAQAAAGLVHPNIVNVYDVGQEEGIYYIIMECVPGKTLKELIAERGALEPLLAVHIAEGIASALQHAHSRGIVHCDIKPHNILLDANNNPKVADFGIARAISAATMTYTADVIGSVHYLSPEQARGEKISTQSDIYSLGVVLFEMLTGRLPFTADTPVAVALKHVREEVPSVRVFNKQLPVVLEKIVAKSLAKSLAERYHTAEELLSDLEYAGQLIAQADLGVENHEFFADERLVSNEVELGNTVVLNRATFPQEMLYDAATLAEQAKATKKKKRQKLAAGVLVFCSLIVCYLFFTGSFVSKEVPVPDVTGKTVTEAQKLLHEANLSYVIDEEYDAQVKPGIVRGQEPPPQQIVKEGRKIKLIVSKGVEMVDVPNLLRKNLTEAKSLLKKAGLELGTVKVTMVKGAPEESVLEQAVPAPAKLPKGTSMDIVINIRNNQVILPNLVGKTKTEAKAILNDLGLRVGRISEKVSPQNAEIVLETSPTAESVVEVNAEVALTVAQNNKTQNYIAEFIVPAGGLQEAKIVVVDNEGRRTIYSNKVKGGSIIRQQIEGAGTIRIQFYCDGRLLEEKRL
ncbi:MAG: Stk1 family PASTA domain-containing Ser/Thr kinase [Acidaminococcaceae bacterium]